MPSNVGGILQPSFHVYFSKGRQCFHIQSQFRGNIFILTLSDTRAFSFHLPRLLGGFHDPSLSTDEIYGRSIVRKEGQVQLKEGTRRTTEGSHTHTRLIFEMVFLFLSRNDFQSHKHTRTIPSHALDSFPSI